jgi:hypothetical protein
VKIHKNEGTNHSDVTVQLFATSNNEPDDFALLASTTIHSNSIGTSYNSIKVPLAYHQLTNGTKYAIVLGQTANSESNCSPLNMCVVQFDDYAANIYN